MAGVTLRAAAKLNLFLHILSRRGDGYHEIESLVAFTEIGDELVIADANDLLLKVEGEFANVSGALHDNLVLKAAQALCSGLSESRGAAITLTKNIPVGAGLGGGSADAAAALRGLNRFWELNISKQELSAIACTLGADVAMCLDSVPAIARGIGEKLTPLLQPLPLLGVLLVHPRVPLLTKQVYETFTLHEGAAPWQGEQTAGSAWLASLKGTRNDLQQAAIAVDSKVAEVLLALETLQPAPALVRMTGSGACCFALFQTSSQAEKAAQYLTRHHPEWWVRSTRFRHTD
ncbi:MAG: 4-(cytidine 5'-diphospho)-2-C-methyl-D-erythritol kinase [Rickettsiales bacterium]